MAYVGPLPQSVWPRKTLFLFLFTWITKPLVNSILSVVELRVHIFLFFGIYFFLVVARFDFSWGDAEFHQETLENLKMAIKSTQKLCAVSLLHLHKLKDRSLSVIKYKPYPNITYHFIMLICASYTLPCFPGYARHCWSRIASCK